MRFPVFRKHANPRVDPPIFRKSMSYVEADVAMGNSDWIDVNDKSKGIICRSNRKAEREQEESRASGSGFDTAWGIRQSGDAGPLVWQLRTQQMAQVSL